MKEVYELMKKTLSRFLCALLVVAMVCAMAPAALAANTPCTVTPAGAITMTVAETGKSAAATSSDADATYHGITYSVTASNPAGCVSVDSATGAVSATAAGTATITATCKCGSTATTAVTVN